MEHKEPIYYRFWFSWVVLTLLYLGLGDIPIFAFLVGLFVPFGFFNTMLSLSIKGVLTFPLLILSLYYADSVARTLQITNPFKKLVFNLVWLLILTLVVDLILSYGWQSLYLFLNGGKLDIGG